jgi:hypothetical protein
MTKDRRARPASPSSTPGARALRAPFTVVHGWADLIHDLADHQPPRLVIADVDPAVSGWGADADAMYDSFRRIEHPLTDALPSDCAVVWATNTTRVAGQLGSAPHHTPAGHRLVLGAGKPRLSELHLALGPAMFGPGVVVVGDQWLIDGVLARRLGARFILWDDYRRRPPLWTKLQLLAGIVTVRPFYTCTRSEPGQNNG